MVRGARQRSIHHHPSFGRETAFVGDLRAMITGRGEINSFTIGSEDTLAQEVPSDALN
jgi:hypothetical protein